MISFYYEIKVDDLEEDRLASWISSVILSEEKAVGEISYIFCDDSYLLDLNQRFLSHDTYTDVIGFENSIGDELHGDIFISYERVVDNAKKYGVEVADELKRVMVHGVLHFCGYKDKTEQD